MCLITAKSAKVAKATQRDLREKNFAKLCDLGALRGGGIVSQQALAAPLHGSYL